MSTDDGIPTLSNAELMEHYKARGVHNQFVTPLFVRTSPLIHDEINAAPTLLEVHNEKVQEVVHRTAVRRARHEWHKVLFPILRRASKAVDSGFFAGIPKDVLRTIAWTAVNHRVDELTTMFQSAKLVRPKARLLATLGR
jgi:delta-aminolevulinic acid dehydratase/porphobilinogen synthase